jgi:RNA polymerase sigma factor (sigma-70 family)
MGVTSTALADAERVDPLRDFRGVYRAHYGFVWHALHRFGTTPMLLDDAVQDVFVVAYRRRADYRGPSPKPWLYGIARRVASNYRRASRRRVQRDQALPRAARTDRADPAREAIETLDRFLAGLSPHDRELFVLAKLEGMTGRELAEATGRNMQTLYTRLRKLENELQGQLGELERVRRARPRATAQSWALLMPALQGGALPAASGVAAAAASGWGWVAALGVAALGLAIVDPLHDDADPATPIAASTIQASEQPRSISAVEPATVTAPAADPIAPRAEAGAPASAASSTAARDRAARERPRRSDPDPSTDAPVPEGLAVETELLRRASTALQEGDAAAALRTSSEHARRFPGSALADLRSAVRIEALCDLGKTAQARGEAHVFLRANPGSPVAERIEHACTSPPKKLPDPDKTGT